MGKKIGTEEFSYIYPSIRRHLLVKRKRSKSVNKGEFDLHCYIWNKNPERFNWQKLTKRIWRLWGVTLLHVTPYRCTTKSLTIGCKWIIIFYMAYASNCFKNILCCLCFEWINKLVTGIENKCLFFLPSCKLLVICK